MATLKIIPGSTFCKFKCELYRIDAKLWFDSEGHQGYLLTPVEDKKGSHRGYVAREQEFDLVSDQEGLKLLYEDNKIPEACTVETEMGASFEKRK